VDVHVSMGLGECGFVFESNSERGNLNFIEYFICDVLQLLVLFYWTWMEYYYLGYV